MAMSRWMSGGRVSRSLNVGMTTEHVGGLWESRDKTAGLSLPGWHSSGGGGTAAKPIVGMTSGWLLNTGGRGGAIDGSCPRILGAFEDENARPSSMTSNVAAS